MRLGALLEDDGYRQLARQTCSTFSVELMQHPFLYVNLLDALVGLELGIRNVTGVIATDDATSHIAEESSGETPGREAIDIVRKRVRAEAGTAASTSVTVVSVVDVRQTAASTLRSTWLQSRNSLFRDLKSGTSPKNHLLVCESGSCRVVNL